MQPLEAAVFAAIDRNLNLNLESIFPTRFQWCMCLPFANKMKTASILIFMLMSTFQTFATTQEEDLLIVHGRRIYTHDMPDLKTAFPNFKIPEFVMISTGNYKGYVATWAVFDKELFLVGIYGQLKGKNSLIHDKEVFDVPFPIKVVGWSGTIKQSNKAFELPSLDSKDTDSIEFEIVSTVVFKDGVLISAAFDEEIPNRPAKN